MNYAEAARTGRPMMLQRYDVDQKKNVPRTGWLELQANGFLVDMETGDQFYPEKVDILSDLWKVQEETVKVTAKEIMEHFRSFLYRNKKKELIQITDGVNERLMAEDFVRLFDFKEFTPESVPDPGNEDARY